MFKLLWSWVVAAALFAALSMAPASAAATALPATISENMTLTAAGNPYTGSPTIASGVTVKAEPGVKFKIGTMTVKGTLKAEGTAEESVVFTGSKEEKAGEWQRIVFESGSGASVLDHAEVAYGAGNEIGAVEINTSSPTITHTTFRKNEASAIRVLHGGSPEIAHDTFIDNGHYYLGRATVNYNATPAEPGEVNIHDNLVEGGGAAGISVSNTSTVGSGGTLGGNTAIENEGAGISYSGVDIPGDITENTLVGNGLIVSGTVAHSSTWNKGGAAIDLGEVTVAAGVTLKMGPGVILFPDKLVVKGTLKAEGTAEEPVVFTGAKEEPGEWRYIRFEPGSGESVLDHTEVAYGAYAEVAAVEINASSPTITHTTFRKNQTSAIRVLHGGSPEIAHDVFIDNGHYYLGRDTLIYTATPSEPGEVNIHDNLVEGGGASGISVSNTSTVGSGGTLSGNAAIENEGNGISYSGVDIPGDITENTLIGNENDLLIVSGTVAHSSTWNKGGGTIDLGDVTVAAGVTLKISPGVTLLPTKFVVKGTLKAEGTAEEPVVFTGAKEEKSGEWQKILFEPGSGASVLDRAEIAHGASGEIGAVEINASSPTITETVFRKNQSSAIKVLHGGSPEIAHNTFIDNGHYYLGRATLSYTATPSEPGEVNIYDNLVEDGGWTGITVSNTSTVGTGGTLSGNTAVENEGAGISYSGVDIPANITENTLVGNESNVITVSGTVAHSSTWNKGGATISLGETTVAAGVTLRITPGVFLLPSKLIVKGTLKTEGTTKEPVVFTGAKEEKAGEWSYIKFEPGSGESVLDHTEVAFGGSPSSSGMIEAKGSHPKVSNSTIRKAKYYGIKVTESGAPQIEWNRFRGNTNGLSYAGTGSLSAPNNDWGCASGPKPAGCGDSVTSNVSWKPAVQLPELAGHCRGQGSQCGEGADPVSLATGQLNYSHRDLLLTNKSNTPLEFTRAYSSGSGSDTGLGTGWSQTGLASATELESGEVFILRQDGRQDLFEKLEGGYKAPSGVTDTLVKVEGTFQLTTLQGTVYRFDASGRIVSITDDHGLKTTFAYNSEGRLSTITDPSAQTLTLTYNASNHITLVKDSTGREVKFGYSAASDLETVTDTLGGVTKYAYDSQHRITTITDPRSNVILKNTYDSQGRIVEQRDGLENLWKLAYGSGETTVTEPGGGKLIYGFDSQSRIVSETDQLGNKTTTVYDSAGSISEVIRPGAEWTLGHDTAGNLTSVKDPEGGERKYEYDAKNRLTKFTDVRGNSWSYEWSVANDLTKITDPEGGETTLTYNESGQPLTITDANKHKTELSYDSRGNRLTVTDPLAHKWSFEYNSRNYLTSKAVPGLKAESYERDALGDLLSRTTPEGHKTKYSYDANGLPTQITDPSEGVWKIAYNAMERPITYTDPLEQQTNIAYNGNLRPTKVTNRRGKETTYGYDLANRLTEVHAPEGGNWSFGYDARGNRTSVTDPRKSKTTYEYDLLDGMTKANEPLSVTTEYGYDANGDLTSIKDSRGNTTSYTYDKLDRLTKVAQPLEKTTSFTYDGVGDLLSRSTAVGTVEYGYDAANRLTSIGAGESMLRSFGYDSANRLTAATDAKGHKVEISYNNDGLVTSINDGRGRTASRKYNSRGNLIEQVDGRGTLSYGYDKLSRMTSLTDPQSKALGFSYDPEANLTGVELPNGVMTTNVYDNADRLAETTSKAGETVLESLEYVYDDAGNRTSQRDRLAQETIYSYDALNRLTLFNPPGEGSTSYGYDTAGNRTEAGGTTYSFNSLNQLTGASDGTSYGYDGAGRLTEVEKGEQTTTYGWNPLDQLTSANGEGPEISYTYDAFDRQATREEGSAIRPTHYGDLTDTPILDTDAENQVTMSYVQGPQGLVQQRSGEATAFPLPDAHGDILTLTNGEGGIASRQTYDPWGTQLSGPSLEMGYLGAQGRRTDPSVGLSQMGVRVYGFGQGSFLSEDPMLGRYGQGQSLNRYAYVQDNPINYFDLDGRMTIEIPGTPIELHPMLPTPGNPVPELPVTIDGVPSLPEVINNQIPNLPIENEVEDRANDFIKDKGGALVFGCLGGGLGGLGVLNAMSGGAPIFIPGVGWVTELGAAGLGCGIGAAGNSILGINPVRTR